jgi:hypothetical protein
MAQWRQVCTTLAWHMHGMFGCLHALASAQQQQSLVTLTPRLVLLLQQAAMLVGARLRQRLLSC